MIELAQTLATLQSPNAAREHAVIIAYRLWRAHGWHPKKTTAPLSCLSEGCLGWQYHDVLEVSDEGLTAVCPHGHKSVHPIPAVRDEIRGSYTRGMVFEGRPITLATARKKLETHYAATSSRFKQFRFSKVRKGYEEPHVLHAASFAPLVRWPSSQYTEARRVVHIIDKLYHPGPMFKWVCPDLFCALQRSDLPSAELSEIEFAWPQGAFFLHRDSLTFPSGAPCSFVAFAQIEEGYTAIRDNAQAMYSPCRKLLIWAFSSQEQEAFTGELTLAGNLDTADFHPDQNPGDVDKRAFLRRLFHHVIMLNSTAHLNPVIVEESQQLKTIKKKGKRRKDAPPVYLYNAPLFGLPRENPEYVAKVSDSKRKKPGSHWRKSFKQRHYRGPLKGKRSVFQVYHPAQWIIGAGQQVRNG